MDLLLSRSDELGCGTTSTVVDGAAAGAGALTGGAGAGVAALAGALGSVIGEGCTIVVVGVVSGNGVVRATLIEVVGPVGLFI